MLRDHHFFLRFVQHISANPENVVEQNQTAALLLGESGEPGSEPGRFSAIIC
jgi:hypothetical protein